MAVTGIETRLGGLWRAKQAAAGTATAPTHASVRAVHKAGDDGLKANKVLGREEYVDGRFWSGATEYIESSGGDVGSIEQQVTIVEAAHSYAQLFASDTVTGAGDPYTHTIVSGSVVPQNQTFWQKLGSAVGPIRQRWYDAKTKKHAWNNGQSQKVAHVTEDIMALNAAQVFATDPTATVDTADPLNWNKAVTTVNGTALPEVSGDTVEADAGIDVWRGQGIKPICFTFGVGDIMRTLSAIVTDGTTPHLLNVLYGSTSPSDLDDVTNAVVTLAIVTTWTQSTDRTFSITTPKVTVNPSDWILGPKAEGGAREVAFGGRCQPNGATPAITIVAKTADSAAYV